MSLNCQFGCNLLTFACGLQEIQTLRALAEIQNTLAFVTACIVCVGNNPVVAAFAHGRPAGRDGVTIKGFVEQDSTILRQSIDLEHDSNRNSNKYSFHFLQI